MATDAALNVRLGAKTAGFDKAMKRASWRVKKFGRAMKKVGSNMTRNFTMPIALMGVASVKMALDFEKSMTKVNTLVGVSKKEVEKLKKEVLDLSGKTATAPNELAEGLYFLTSAGLSGADAMEALEQVSKGVVSGLGESADLANVAAAAQNAYGKATMSASKALDIFGGMVKTGMFNAADLSKVLGTQLGLSASLGISFEEVGAMISTYTKTTGDANAATTGLSGVMMSFAKITPKQEEALKKVKLSAKSLRDMLSKKGLQGTLLEMQKRFKANGVEMSDFFSKSQSLKAVLGVLGNQTETYKAILDTLYESTGFVNSAFEETAETSAFKMQKAINDLVVAGTQLGNTMFPIVDKLAKKISALATWFSKLTDQQKKNVVQWGLILAAVGPVLSIFGSMVIKIGALIPVLINVARGFRAVTVAMMSNPYVALGAIVAGFIVYMATLGRTTKKATKEQTKYNTKLREANDIMNEVAGLKISVKHLNLLSKAQKEVLLEKLKAQKVTADQTRVDMQIFAKENAEFKKVDQSILALRRTISGKADFQKASIYHQIKELTTESRNLVKEKFGESFSKVSERANQLARDINRTAKSIKADAGDLETGDGGTDEIYDPLTDPALIKEKEEAAAKVKADAKKASNQKLKELNRQFNLEKISDDQIAARVSLMQDEQRELESVTGMENETALKLAIMRNYTQKLKKLGLQQVADNKEASAAMIPPLKKAADEKVATWNKFAAKVAAIMNGLSNLNSALNEKESIELEQKQEREAELFNDKFELEKEQMENSYQSWYEDQKRIIEDTITNDEQKRVALENLEKQAQSRKEVNDAKLAKKQADFDEKQDKAKRKLARKQAVRERILRVAEIIMSTAAGIMNAVSTFWITGGMPWAGIVAGLGAMQIGTVLSTPLPSLAAGGVAFGDSLARVGDYAGASANPEVIAPLDRLKALMPTPNNQTQKIEVVGRIKGNDIFLGNERADTERLRFT